MGRFWDGFITGWFFVGILLWALYFSGHMKVYGTGFTGLGRMIVIY